MRRHVRFAAGLAAGLAIGLALHFVLPVVSPPDRDPAGAAGLAQVPENRLKVEQPIFPGHVAGPAGDVILNVDWYNFTDKQGNKWIVEGLRENIVRPAVYYGDL
jgi:hypothetical protein